MASWAWKRWRFWHAQCIGTCGSCNLGSSVVRTRAYPQTCTPATQALRFELHSKRPGPDACRLLELAADPRKQQAAGERHGTLRGGPLRLLPGGWVPGVVWCGVGLSARTELRCTAMQPTVHMRTPLPCASIT